MDPLARAPDTERPPALTRREVLRRGAVLGAAVWAAPAIARLPAAVGAAGSAPDHCEPGGPSVSGGVRENPYVVDWSGPGTFDVPAGVTRVTVEVWGAGGDGSPTPGPGGQGSGGGGGGGWARSVLDVGACSSYAFQVGSAGGGSEVGATWFRGDGPEVRATGGQNGAGRDGGAGGTGVGENTASGGVGGNGAGNGGGGGGASAGPWGNGSPGADGQAGAGNLGGTGGVANLDAGSGGAGGDSGQMGMDGDAPGGGGGGTGRNGSPAGVGGHGRIRISWAEP